MMHLTHHAKLQCAQRNIDRHAIEMVARYGRRIHWRGQAFYILDRRDIPDGLHREDYYDQLEEVTLVVDPKVKVIITAYRNLKTRDRLYQKIKHR